MTASTPSVHCGSTGPTAPALGTARADGTAGCCGKSALWMTAAAGIATTPAVAAGTGTATARSPPGLTDETGTEDRRAATVGDPEARDRLEAGVRTGEVVDGAADCDRDSGPASASALATGPADRSAPTRGRPARGPRATVAGPAKPARALGAAGPEDTDDESASVPSADATATVCGPANDIPTRNAAALTPTIFGLGGAIGSLLRIENRVESGMRIRRGCLRTNRLNYLIGSWSPIICSCTVVAWIWSVGRPIWPG
jgi:hypothetical protein